MSKIKFGVYNTDKTCAMSGQASSHIEALEAIKEHLTSDINFDKINLSDCKTIDKIVIKRV